MSAQVVGLGEPLVDHIFVSEAGAEPVYRGSRGGGTLANVVANLASWGVEAAIAGAVGRDDWGRVALQELSNLGVDVSLVATVPRRATRVIFQRVRSTRESLIGNVSHIFGSNCLICGRRQDDRLVARAATQHLAAGSPAVVLVDRLTSARLDAVEQARAAGATAVLDLGQVGHLRFVPVADLAAALTLFDLVFMPASVAASLERRLDVDSLLAIGREGPRLGLIVTDGDKGLRYLLPTRRRQAVEVLAAPRVDKVRDTSGAGDVLLARIVYRLIRDGTNTAEAVRDALPEALEAVRPVITVLGARGHLGFSLDFPTEDFVGGRAGAIARSIPSRSTCPFCGSVVSDKVGRAAPPKRRIPGAKANVAQLRRRVLFATERRQTISACRRLLERKGTCFVVGTGGSYPVAAFIADVLNGYGRMFAQPIRPFDYIRAPRPSDYLIAVTYSGSTADCGEAIAFAKEIGVPHIVLMTGSARPKLASHLRASPAGTDAVISYAPTSGARLERGFVSIAGTVMPCAVWATAVVGSAAIAAFARDLKDDIETATAIEKIAQAVTDGKGLLVFGGGNAWPAMIDVESKFAEAGLGIVQLHESKDFSHGRFMSVFRGQRAPRAALLLCVGPAHEYEERLIAELESVLDVVVLQSRNAEILGSLELLMRVQQVVQRCGAALGYDISRPAVVPPEGLRLYRWAGGLGLTAHDN